MNASKHTAAARLARSKVVDVVIGAAVVLVVAANWAAFVYAPPERDMGAVQRIFYFHVASAINSYLAIGTLLVAGLAYLATRSRFWDMLNEASTEAAFVLATIVLGTGMIWGHSAWNTWWRWEPRLVSFLVLWLVLLSSLLLRRFMSEAFGDSHRKSSVCAVMGIISAVNVPLVIFSIKLLDQTQQLHPQVIARQGLTDPRFGQALVLSSVAVFALNVLFILLNLINISLRSELLNRRLEHP